MDVRDMEKEIKTVMQIPRVAGFVQQALPAKLKSSIFTSDIATASWIIKIFDLQSS